MDQKQLMLRLIPLTTDQLWDRLEDYLRYERSKLVEVLIKTTDIRQVNKLQGEINQLDIILNLPSQAKKVAT